ncbi:hypothetical protein DFH06DRAFT_49294 [Mycena polygramma]|nr:hypothetical protein DFH06DRAFT_49294 [Mycena polygramma]
MTTRTVIESPIKEAPIELEVPADASTANHVRTLMSNLGDLSWDVVTVWDTERGIVASRMRPEHRPAARKQRLVEFRCVFGRSHRHARCAVLLDENDTLTKSLHKLQEKVDALSNRVTGEAEGATLNLRFTLDNQAELIRLKELEVASAIINEVHEVIDRCLRAFNDIMFDSKRTSGPLRKMSNERRQRMKKHGLGYITYLLDPSSLPKHHRPMNSQTQRDLSWTIEILSKDELELCHALHDKWKEGRDARNVQQHPVPDIATALERSGSVAGRHQALLTTFLETDPRMKGKDGEYAPLFARPGMYTPVSQLELDLKEMRTRKSALESLWAARKVGGSAQK